MKKALFLAYYYPPYGGGGVQRTTKYVKYLREYGWEPVVLTIREEKITLRDESLLADVPENLEIHRTDIWGLTFIEKLLKRRATKAKEQGKIAEASKAKESSEKEAIEKEEAFKKETPAVKLTPEREVPQGQSLKTKAKGMLRQALRAVFLFVYSFLLYPDDKIGWYPFATRKAKERMERGDIDLIYTTSAPFTAHLIGLKLKKLTGKPWVMDLRDPWAGNKYLNFSNLRKPLDRLVEGWCVRNADYVVTVSEPLLEDLLQSYPKEPQEKFVVIPNGYDEDDLIPPQKNSGILENTPLQPEVGGALETLNIPTKNPNTLVLSYTGSFYNEISPRYFLAAMDELLKTGRLPKEDIRIEFAGQFGAESLQLITAFQTNYPEVISVSGYVPHSEATRRMLTADILLLFLNKGAGKGVLTGKLFEYLGTRKPVLAMIPQGLASDLIQKSNAGLIAPPEDQKEIQTAILDYHTRWKAGNLVSTTDPEVAGQYSRRALAGRLSELFNKLS